jgi:GNAT superfamily N-acetyltransferase
MRIRALGDADIAVARDLLGQLGYAVSEEVLRGRVARACAATDHYVAVAEHEGRMVGLLHAFERPALEKPCEVVVQALVVDARVRGQGIGTALMEAAEDWARGRSLASVVLHTRDAPDYYVRLGYGRVATSDLMRKNLATDGKQP